MSGCASRTRISAATPSASEVGCRRAKPRPPRCNHGGGAGWAGRRPRGPRRRRGPRGEREAGAPGGLGLVVGEEQRGAKALEIAEDHHRHAGVVGITADVHVEHGRRDRGRRGGLVRRASMIAVAHAASSTSFGPCRELPSCSRRRGLVFSSPTTRRGRPAAGRSRRLLNIFAADVENLASAPTTP